VWPRASSTLNKTSYAEREDSCFERKHSPCLLRDLAGPNPAEAEDLEKQMEFKLQQSVPLMTEQEMLLNKSDMSMSPEHFCRFDC